MTKYYDVGGEIVPADDAAQLVLRLWQSSKVPVEDTAAFRERAAFWARNLYGGVIRTEDDEVFLADMLASGLFKEVDKPEGWFQ